MKSITEISESLLNNAALDCFAGYDPFDSLNSKLFNCFPFTNNSYLKLAWLQLGKRSPINLRPLALVPKERNPKGIGLFVSGLLQDYYRTKDQRYLDQATALGDWLITHCSPPEEWLHACWGYHFDWQARAFYVPKGKPNIITTCYVARALFELGVETNRDDFRSASLDAARFISRTLYTEKNGRVFYAYIPGETAFVHNASLWGAAWCVFAGKELGDTLLVEQGLKVARQSVEEQNPDGSWVYGALDHHRFIDGFHTGYNLEALCMIRDSVEISDFDSAIEKGYSYYLANFIESDGTVRYYNNKRYPLDMHSVAQAIFTLLKVGGKPSDEAICHRVVYRAVELLYLPRKEQFAYQKNQWFTNKINYIRWTQAWSYYSLAWYNRYFEYNKES